MNRKDYNKQLIKWVKNHYWDSLEKDKNLILRHLRTFVGDEVFTSNSTCIRPHGPDSDLDKQG